MFLVVFFQLQRRGDIFEGDTEEIYQSVAEMSGVAHEDHSTWFIDCSRVEAEQMLENRPKGTFLIRPSRQGAYALSIV